MWGLARSLNHWMSFTYNKTHTLQCPEYADPTPEQAKAIIDAVMALPDMPTPGGASSSYLLFQKQWALSREDEVMGSRVAWFLKCVNDTRRGNEWSPLLGVVQQVLTPEVDEIPPPF